MSQKTKQWLGLISGLLLMGSFFALMFYFELFGTSIQYDNPIYVTKSAIAFSTIPLALFVLLWSLGAKEIAYKVFLLMVSLLVAAFIIGSLGFGALISFLLLEAYLLYGLFDGLKSGEFLSNYNSDTIRKSTNPYHYWFMIILIIGMMIFIGFKAYLNWEYIYIF